MDALAGKRRQLLSQVAVREVVHGHIDRAGCRGQLRQLATFQVGSRRVQMFDRLRSAGGGGQQNAQQDVCHLAHLASLPGRTETRYESKGTDQDLTGLAQLP